MDNIEASYSTWTATIEFMKELGEIHKASNRALIKSKMDHNYLFLASDYVHRFYGMISGYLVGTDATDLEKIDKDTQLLMLEYREKEEEYRRRNFINYYNEIDAFFIKLEQQAIKRNIFPKPNFQKSLKATAETLKQE